jgi:hypothetical protein
LAENRTYSGLSEYTTRAYSPPGSRYTGAGKVKDVFVSESFEFGWSDVFTFIASTETFDKGMA